MIYIRRNKIISNSRRRWNYLALQHYFSIIKKFVKFRKIVRSDNLVNGKLRMKKEECKLDGLCEKEETWGCAKGDAEGKGTWQTWKKRDNGEKDGGIRLVPGEEASIEAERNIFRLATISLYPGTGCSTPHRENVVTPWRSIDLVVSSLAPTFAVLFVLFMISLAWATNVSRSDQMVINLGNVILS